MLLRSLVFRGFVRVQGVGNFGTIPECPRDVRRGGLPIHTASRAFALDRLCRGYSVTPERGSFASRGGGKTFCGTCGAILFSWYDRRTRRARDLPNGEMRVYLELEVRRVLCRRCQVVKRERLDFLAANPFYTQRFAFYVGRRCRVSTVKDLADELLLNWHTVKELDKHYMREQLRRVGTPGPKIIGLAGNFWSLRKVYCRVARYWYKMLCSRSWAGRFTWEVFNQVLERFPLQHP